MSSHEHEHADEGRNVIWLLPPVLILLVVIIAVFLRVMTGTSTDKAIDAWGTDFVPAESAYSTGEHSR